MATDITRSTFDRSKHYSSVRKQQGRVDIDADFNEQGDILLHLERTANKDIIGRAGGPIGDAGFQITAGGSGILIGAGRYYVDGILVENEAHTDYGAQPDLPWPDGADPYPGLGGRYLFYLDVWERPITYLEDPAIREVALGGPDHGTRTKVIAQVRALEARNGQCGDFQRDWAAALADPNVLLQARTDPGEPPLDPCKVPASAGYRSLENQLYRVEIWGEGALGTATFTWSRENASVATLWIDQGGDTLTVQSAGRDANLGFSVGNWVELNNEIRALQGLRGVLIRLGPVTDQSLEVDFATAIYPAGLAAPATVEGLMDLFPGLRTVRRWESADGTTPLYTVEIPVDGDDYQDLENGVQVRFTNGTATDADGNLLPSNFRTADHWLIPARVNGADVEWPQETGLPKAMPPYGIKHHYARLAIASFIPGVEGGPGTWTIESDCRCLFPPLCDLPDAEDCCCCEITVGADGGGNADTQDIQSAVDQVASGLDGPVAHICLQPGTHRLRNTVFIENKHLVISGCKGRTFVVAPQGQPAFIATGSMVHFKEFDVLASTAPTQQEPVYTAFSHAGNAGIQAPGAVQLVSCAYSSLWEMAISNIPAVEPGPPNLTFNMADSDPGRTARKVDLTTAPPLQPALVVLSCEGTTIERCAFEGYPAVQLQSFKAQVRNNELTRGGLEIAGGSAMVAVEENTIQSGFGHGIALGSSFSAAAIRNTPDEEMKGRLNYVYSMAKGMADLTIERNRIADMELCGIASVGRAGRNGSFTTRFDDVRIEANVIEGCAQRELIRPFDENFGGIVLQDCHHLRIANNGIRNNGGRGLIASGIILEDCSGASILSNNIENNGSHQDTLGAVLDLRYHEPFEGASLAENGITLANVQGQPLELDGVMFGMWLGLAINGKQDIQLDRPARSMQLLVLGGSVTVEGDGGLEFRDYPPADETMAALIPRLVDLRGTSELSSVRIYTTEGSKQKAHLLRVGTNGLDGIQAGIAALYAHVDARPSSLVKKNTGPGGHALLVEGNTVICPAGQALIAHGIGDMSVQDNVLYSHGEYLQPINGIGATDLVAEDQFIGLAMQLGRTVSMLNTGQMAELMSMARPGFGTNLSSADPSPIVVKPINRALGGRILCSGNQTEWLNDDPVPNKIALPSIMLFTMDDAGFQQNQVRSHLAAGKQYVDVLIFSFTNRVQGNRVQETPLVASEKIAGFSIMDFGLLPNLSDNITTRCVYCLDTPWTVERDNRVLLAPPPQHEKLCAAAKSNSYQMLADTAWTPPASINADPDATTTYLMASSMRNAEALPATASRSYSARLQRKRFAGEALEAVLRKLSPENPDIIKLVHMRSQAARDLETWHGDRATRAMRTRPNAPGEWSFTGHVMHKDGSPAPGLIVQLMLKETELTKAPMSARTDEFGDFRITLDTRAMKDKAAPASPSSAVLAINEASGKEITKRTVAVQCEAGRTDHATVVVDPARTGYDRDGKGPYDGPKPDTGDRPQWGSGKGKGRKKA